MITRTSEELDRIGEAEELELASVRRDGSLRRPVTMWVVRDGDDLYVPSILAPKARAATLRLVPRATDAGGT